MYNTKISDKKQYQNNVITKILGLNVCGLKSKLNNGIFDDYAKNYDILCLSETKLGQINDIDFSGTTLEDYHCFIKEKTCNTHKYGGVHGLCMLVKNNIVNHSKPVTGVKSPYVLWRKFNKEAFGLSCIIGSVYLPCGNPTHKDNTMFDTIYDDISYMKLKLKLPICLIGDMNSRTGNLDDTLDFEREVIGNSETNDYAEYLCEMNFFDETNIINKRRVNADKITNDNGKALINLCKANNVIIVNGRTGSDRNKGDITFKGHNGSSTIDYCIISPDIIPHIQDFQVDILDKNLSDKHSPIILTLKTKNNENHTTQNEIAQETDIDYEQINSLWSDEKKLEFQTNFDQNKINNLFQTLASIETNTTNQTEMNDLVKEISNVSIMAGINAKI